MTTEKKRYKRWSFLKRAFYLSLTPILPRIFRILFRFEVKSGEHADEFPEGRGVIFCSNHQSHLDGFMVAMALITPFGRRRFLTYIVSGKAMQKTVLFRLTTLLGSIPIFSENPKPALNHARRSIQEGLAFLITPQGRRIHRTPYHDFFNLAEEGRTGVGRLILDMNGDAPVVPLYVRGAAEALRPGTLIPRFKSYISISFGEPLYFKQYYRQDGWSEKDPEYYTNAREITDAIMKAIREQMLSTEKPYFDFLEWKFNTPVDKINVSPEKERKFTRLLHKLARVPPAQIQEFLESKGIKKDSDQ
ncbi:MAG: lysophospholipid acyltransferase family protein [Candidatus Odinarchaeota archaeon]